MPTPITVSVNFIDLTGNPIQGYMEAAIVSPSGHYDLFVAGTGIIAPKVTISSIGASASVSIWGNDVVVDAVDGQQDTYYTVNLFNSSNILIWTAAYLFDGTGPINLVGYPILNPIPPPSVPSNQVVPGGVTNDVQVNEGGTFYGDANFQYIPGSQLVKVINLQVGTQLTLEGSSSGSTTLGAAAVAGTPNRINLPTSTGSAGQVLTTDGGNPQQLSWTTSTVFANPMTTLGDTIYENATPTAARLPGNTTTAKEYLSQTGTGSISAAPAWAQIAFPDISGILPLSQGGTGTATPSLIAGTGISVTGTFPAQTITNTSVSISTANIQTFTSTGTSTWTKPAGAKSIQVMVIGAGGGGGGGGTGGNPGGGGGGGGAASVSTLAASLVGATETVTVGAGGSGGASGTVGGVGGTGNTSSFGAWLQALGGGAGTGAGAAPGGSGATGNLGNHLVNPGSPHFSGNGGAGSSSGVGGIGVDGGGSAAGGGGGGSNFSSVTPGGNGGAGGASHGSSLSGGLGGTSAGGSGVNAAVGEPFGGPGGGGGGGNSGTSPGGTPLRYGGGGGGGGTNSSGGAGAPGIVVVTTYF